MEVFEGKKMTDETLSGVSSVSQPDDGGENVLKPSLEETAGDDLGTVVVTTKVVETTEVSVVEMVQEDKENEEGECIKKQEHGVANEVIENVNEGLFGNFAYDDDDDDDDDGGGGGGGSGDLDVNWTENGASKAMDVEDSKAEEDASGKNLVSEGNEGVLADESGDNAGGDPMEISLPLEKEQNNENGTKVSQLNDEINKNDEENVEIREDNGSKIAENKELNGEQGGSEEEEHNFIVGDFVWGKVKSNAWWPGQIYNPSDASENAARLKGEGQLLVAYFGDGSFSWCSPSQLKPFIDHFQEMSNQSDSKKFVNAVKMALVEVSRLVEAEWMCKCQTVKRDGNAVVSNKGIKKGVPVPKGNTIKVLVERMEPLELLLTLKGCVAMAPGTGLGELELAVLKSCLNAFYRTRGSYFLVEYQDPKRIKSLDINGPLERVDNGDGKSYQRKQKSVADLLREEEPKSKKMKISKDGGSGKRKRKALVVSVMPESDNESGGGGVENESGSGGVEEETMSPRQRKKSKYLSPPYLSPVGGGKLSVFGSGPGSGSFKEPKPESENDLEMAAVEDPSKKSSGKRSQKRVVREGSDPQEEQNKTIDADVNVNDVVHGLLRVALDPTSFEKDLPAVTDFISSYRRSIFKEGSSAQTDQKNGGDTMDVVITKQKSETNRKKRDGDTSDVSLTKPKAETGRKKKADLAFIKQKLESMIGIVQRCEETQMSADVKASLEGGMQEVLEKVGKMKGK